MDASSQLAAVERFRSYLGIDGAAMARLGHRLRKRPMPLSELADVGSPSSGVAGCEASTRLKVMAHAA